MSNENNPDLTEVIKEIYDGVAKEMYCKGIDDFATLMKAAINKDWVTNTTYGPITYNRLFDKCNEIAEELKGGASGASEDMCEWELKNACYTTSIKHYYSLPTSIVKTFNNCPYCGKKIKVVE